MSGIVADQSTTPLRTALWRAVTELFNAAAPHVVRDILPILAAQHLVTTAAEHPEAAARVLHQRVLVLIDEMLRAVAAQVPPEPKVDLDAEF